MKKFNIIAILTKNDGSKSIIRGKNIVTNDGDIYYAQKVAGEPTDFENPSMRLGTDTTSPDKTDTDVKLFIAGSNKPVDAGFPQRNNGDPGNTLGGVNTVTWKISYDLGDLNVTDIAEAAIVDDGTAPTKAICRFLFDSPFDVSDTDQLTVYVNHTMVGV
jgi:hypothetical protein